MYGKYRRGKREWNNKYFVHFRFSQPAQKRQFGGDLTHVCFTVFKVIRVSQI